MRATIEAKKNSSGNEPLTKLSYFLAIIPNDVFYVIATFLDVKSILSARQAFTLPLHKNMLTNAMILSSSGLSDTAHRNRLILRESNLQEKISDIDTWRALSENNLRFYSKIKILLEKSKRTNLQIPLLIQNKMVEIIKSIALALTANISAFDYPFSKNMLLLFIPYLDIEKRNECWRLLGEPIINNTVNFQRNEQENIIKFITQIVTIFPEKIDECWGYLTEKLYLPGGYHDHYLYKALAEIAQHFPEKRESCWSVVEKEVHVMMLTGEYEIGTLSQLTNSLTDLVKLMPEKYLSFWILITAGLSHSHYSIRMNSLNFLPQLAKLIPEKKEEFWSFCANNLFHKDGIYFNVLNSLGDLASQFPNEFTNRLIKLIGEIRNFDLYSFFSSPASEQFFHPEAWLEIIKLVYFENTINPHTSVQPIGKLVDIATMYPQLSEKCLSLIKRTFDNSDIYILINATNAYSKIKRIAQSFSKLQSEKIDPKYWSEISTIICKIHDNNRSIYQSKLDSQYLILLTQCALLYPEKRKECLENIVILLNQFKRFTAYDEVCTWFLIGTRSMALLSLAQLSPLSDSEKKLIEFDKILEEEIPYYEMKHYTKTGDFLYSELPSGGFIRYEEDILKPITKFAFAFPEKIDACWNLLTRQGHFLIVDICFDLLVKYLINFVIKFPKKRHDLFYFLIKNLHNGNNQIVKSTLHAIHNSAIGIFDVTQSDWECIVHKSVSTFESIRANGLLLLMKVSAKIQDKEKIMNVWRWDALRNVIGDARFDYHTMRKLTYSLKESCPEMISPAFALGILNHNSFLQRDFALDLYSDFGLDPSFRTDSSWLNNITTQLSIELINIFYETIIPKLHLPIGIAPDSVKLFNQSLYHYVNPLNYRLYKNKWVFENAFNALITTLNTQRNYTPGTFALNPLHLLADAFIEPAAHKLRKILQEVFGEMVFSNNAQHSPEEFKTELYRYVNSLIERQTLSGNIEKRYAKCA